MRTKLEPHQLELLTREFIMDFCRKNQIDYIATQGTMTKRLAGSCEFVTYKMTPTGNTAAIFKSFQVRFEVFNSDSTVFNTRISFEYDHSQRASNSYTLRQAIVCRPSISDPSFLEYVGFVEDDILSAFVNHHAFAKESNNDD